MKHVTRTNTLFAIEKAVTTNPTPIITDQKRRLVAMLTSRLHTFRALLEEQKLQTLNQCVTMVLLFHNQPSETPHVPLDWVWARVFSEYITKHPIFSRDATGKCAVSLDNSAVMLLTQWKYFAWILLYCKQNHVAPKKSEFPSSAKGIFKPFIGEVWHNAFKSAPTSVPRKNLRTLARLYRFNTLGIKRLEEGKDNLVTRNPNPNQILNDILKKPGSDYIDNEPFSGEDSRNIQYILSRKQVTRSNLPQFKLLYMACLQRCKVLPFFIVFGIKKRLFQINKWVAAAPNNTQTQKRDVVASVHPSVFLITVSAATKTERVTTQLHIHDKFTDTEGTFEETQDASSVVVYMQGKEPALPIHLLTKKGVTTFKGDYIRYWAVLSVALPEMSVHGDVTAPLASFICPLVTSSNFATEKTKQTIFMATQTSAYGEQTFYTPRLTTIANIRFETFEGYITIFSIREDEARDQHISATVPFYSFKEFNDITQKLLQGFVQCHPTHTKFGMKICVRHGSKSLYAHCEVANQTISKGPVSHVRPLAHFSY
jgi:hypothetical protein